MSEPLCQCQPPPETSLCITQDLKGHRRSSFSFILGSDECSRTYMAELTEMQEEDSRLPTAKLLLRSQLGVKYQPNLYSDTVSDPR